MSPDPAQPSSPVAPAPVRVALVQPALPRYRIPVFRALAQRPGINLHVFYASDEPVPNVKPEGFRATAIESRQISYRPILWWMRTMLDVLDSSRFDAVILPMNTRYLSLPFALSRARRVGVGTVLWGHGYSKRVGAFRSMLRRRLMAKPAALLFYSRAVRDAWTREHGGAVRCFAAPNALDQAPIQAARAMWLADPARREAFRSANNLSPGPVILFVSRLDPANRVDLLLHAAKSMLSNFPSLRVVILGKGEDLPKLESLSRQLGIAPSVIFPGAIYDESEIAGWFTSADVFCYPRNVGLSILHAFGYGLPVVTCDNPAAQNPEIIAHVPGTNGETYRDLDHADLARVLSALLADRDRLARQAAAAHVTATDTYSLDRMVDGFEAAARYAAAFTRGGRA